MRSSNTSADDRLPAPLAAALEYADFGYGVFPCVAKDRAPVKIAGLFEHGFKSATFDPALITATWTKYKGAEIGLAPPRGVLVVDPDMKRGRNGRADFIRLFGRPPEDMPTAVASTPTGGWHVYLSFDSSLDFVQRPITPSIDVKIGGKGYVLAPYQGNGRRWIRSLLLTPLMEAPQWLVDDLGRPPEPKSVEAKPFVGEASARAQAALDRACKALAHAPPGTRDQTIGAAVFRVGRLAAAGELEPEPALEAMLQAMASNPGTNESHLDKVGRQFSSGFEKPAEPGPVDDRHAVEDDFGAGESGDAPEGVGSEQPSQPSSSSPSSSRSSGSAHASPQQSSRPWPAIDYAFVGSDIPPPELTDDMLPSGWAEIVRDYARMTEAPPDYVALVCNCCAAGAIGNAYAAQGKRQWFETTALWGAEVGVSSAGKTAALSHQRKAMTSINHGLTAKWKEQCAQVEALHQDALDAHEAKSGKKGKAAKKPALPPLVQLTLDDVTIEKVTIIHAESPHGMVGVYPELASWFSAFNRYSGGGDAAVRATWIKTYEGEEISRARVANPGPPVVVPRPAVSLVGGVQPERLREYFDTVNDGLLSRYIFVWPYPPPLPDEEDEEDDVGGRSVGIFQTVFQTLYDLPLTIDAKGVPHPCPLRPEPKAKARFNAARLDCKRRAREERGLVSEWLGKAGGRILRLALVYQFMTWALDPGEPHPSIIGLDAVGRAVRYNAYAEAMLRRTIAGLEPGRTSDDARRLARMAAERGWEHFSEREVSFSPGFSWFKGIENKARRVNVLSVLEDCGVIRRDLVKLAQNVVERWAVNPALDPDKIR
jgi:hypothetical protein